MDLIAKGFFLLLLNVQVHMTSSSFVSEIKRLRDAFQPEFNPNIRPLTTVNVTVGLAISSLDLDSSKETFLVRGKLTVSWYVEVLSWESSSFEDIGMLHVKDGEIWRPELVIENMLDDVSVIHEENLMYRLHSSGTVTWEPPMNVQLHCPLDFTYYPFDKQTCAITISSWSYDHSETSLYSLRDHVNLDMYKENSEFEVVETRVETTQDSESQSTLTRTYSKLTFYVTVKRHTHFYGLAVILPLVLMSALTILTFLLPVESGEKSNYSVTLLLMIVLFYTASLEYIPVFTGVSVLVGYISIVLLLATIATVCNFLVLILFHQDKQLEMKPWQIEMLHMLARLTCKLRPNEDSRSVFTSEGTSSTRVSHHDLLACSSLPNGGLGSKKPGRLSPISRRVEPCEPLANHSALPGVQDHRDTLPPLDITHANTGNVAAQNTISAVQAAKKIQMREKDNTYSKSPWQELSKYLDRLFLVIFLIVSFIAHFIFLVVLGTGSL